MTIKYRELMAEYGVTLESDTPSNGFKSRARTFEEKLKKNELTDEEIEAFDNELIEIFKTEHDLSEVDSDELAEAKRKADLAEAKVLIKDAETIQELNALNQKYKAQFPELIPVIVAKVEKLNQKASNDEAEAKEKLLKVAKDEVAQAAYSELGAYGEKYKTLPEIVEIVNKRIADEAPNEKDKELAAKLRSKKQWSYAELRAIGVEPTGNDMTVAGVKLEKEYLLTIYLVRK